MDSGLEKSPFVKVSIYDLLATCSPEGYMCYVFIVVDCGLLVAPVFGEVNITDTTFGSFANYSCQRGYNINGTSMRVCEDTGQWSHSMPQCIRKIVFPACFIFY